MFAGAHKKYLLMSPPSDASCRGHSHEKQSLTFSQSFVGGPRKTQSRHAVGGRKRTKK